MTIKYRPTKIEVAFAKEGMLVDVGGIETSQMGIKFSKKLLIDRSKMRNAKRLHNRFQIIENSQEQKVLGLFRNLKSALAAM